MKRAQLGNAFTLVEVMVVVVIVGVLAALAIPAIKKNQRVSVRSTMLNDGKLIAHAAQQYFLENSCTSVDTLVLVNTHTTSDMGYLKDLSKGVQGVSTSLEQGGIFSLSHPQFGTISIAVDTGKSVGESLN